MRSFVVLLLAYSVMNYSLRRSANEFVLQGGTVVVVMSPQSLLPPPLPPLFPAPPLSSEKSSPAPLLPFLLASLLSSKSMFLFSFEIVMFLSKKDTSRFDDVRQQQ